MVNESWSSIGGVGFDLEIEGCLDVKRQRED
jgi:hypothetical protein